MKKSNQILLLLLTAVFSAILNAGCNTVHGAGQDIEKAGDKIQDSADRHR